MTSCHMAHGSEGPGLSDCKANCNALCPPPSSFASDAAALSLSATASAATAVAAGTELAIVVATIATAGGLYL